MTEANDIAARLSVLREQYKLNLTGILGALESKVEQIAVSDVTPELLSQLHAELHRLSGSGTTFGFPALSAVARSLEVQAKQWIDAENKIDVAQWPSWRSNLLSLRQTVAGISAPTHDVKATPAASIKSAKAMNAAPSAKVCLVLISDDKALCEELTSGLGQFGYVVTCFPTTNDHWEAAFDGPPEVMVLDILDPTLASGSESPMPKIFEQLGQMVPTVFLTPRADFSAKLSAARIGAGALLSKPIDVPALAAHIDTLLKARHQAPYRVLIVDDDETLAEHYRLTLVSAGMLAERVSRAADALAAMEKWNPDLLLVDLYMPECSGAVLARALRYDAAWQSLPIVYLSSEADLDVQVDALSSGADDFLTKPISDNQLVATVKVRAARARKLSDLMNQDSLTGLLRHASIKERLAQEVERARRQAKLLCAVMVDMDHFKRVNDTWGHPMGDQVIKTLAHLLRQRLRREDSIGRYGGEEFLAVLSDCSAEDAKRLLDDVRARFGELRFSHGTQHFNVTLSVGIACSDTYSTAVDLLAAADSALYVAKHNGRNQVRVAEGSVKSE